MREAFIDQRATIYDFMDELLVVCPRCRGCARVLPRDPDRSAPFDPRRLVCAACGNIRDWEPRGISYAEGRDWYFHLPLWLSAPCCGKTLWALNPRHLDLIERYVGAHIRENTRDPEYGWCNHSLVSRLPGWVKAGKNREEILKAIARLRETI